MPHDKLSDLWCFRRGLRAGTGALDELPRLYRSVVATATPIKNGAVALSMTRVSPQFTMGGFGIITLKVETLSDTTTVSLDLDDVRLSYSTL